MEFVMKLIPPSVREIGSSYEERYVLKLLGGDLAKVYGRPERQALPIILARLVRQYEETTAPSLMSGKNDSARRRSAFA